MARTASGNARTARVHARIRPETRERLDRAAQRLDPQWGSVPTLATVTRQAVSGGLSLLESATRLRSEDG